MHSLKPWFGSFYTFGANKATAESGAKASCIALECANLALCLMCHEHEIQEEKAILSSSSLLEARFSSSISESHMLKSF